MLHGFSSAVLAIAVAAVVIFLTGIPIASACARYGVDMDLLTGGAGFGYFGSTLTSLIYASFTVIFFRSKARSWPRRCSWPSDCRWHWVTC